jgi:thioredoxin reductase (NADPH)
MSDIRNAIILGSGPAGLTAAIYLSRAGLKPLLLSGPQPGGQLTTTTEVENFPGFPKGIMGPQLMNDMEEQAKHQGAEIVFEMVESCDLSQRPFVLKGSGGLEWRTHALVIATGASPRMLGLPSEGRFWNHGIHTCAVCDGGFYKGKEVAVVGGGDSAMEEATYLAKLCARVHVVHRRDTLRASKTMADRALANPKLTFHWDSVVEDVEGELSGKYEKVTAMRIRNLKSGALATVPLAAVFVAIGHTPNTKFLGGQLATDDNGYLKLSHGQMTSIPGVFAAGDVHDHVYRQAITAAGMGCAAALEAERWLTREGLGG